MSNRIISVWFLFILLASASCDTKIVHTKKDKAKRDLDYISEKIEIYNHVKGNYPLKLDELIYHESMNIKKEKYHILRLPIDPWSFKYNYITPGTFNKSSYDLWTYGKDNKQGGLSEDKDIGNW